ncbi:hypothetical protein HYFRA_00006331 [Hymenoscyphus fraxineus]|uniref:Tyrosinase n=1 Tax=Hymenoscyphus fraxineus TaxID=746836 RepID=A0A9N9LC05_9HELO|nr:hypothetical protein HYFRA_00006331 [Hymenoscyphus fraxineus]
MLFSKISASALAVVSTVFFDVVVAKYAITGVHTGVDATTGYRPPRREINELALDKPQFSLYIQALNDMMNVDEHNLTSYFQLSGIHGLPYISWDDVNPISPNSGLRTGYCTHGNTLFATWHRPYLALYEQVLAQHAQTIAKTYKSAEYQTAADNLRMPFWDWALPGSRFPTIMKSPTVQITTPNGTTTVNNPLFNYKFLQRPEPTEWFPANDPISAKAATLRHPDANDVQHDETIDQALAEENSFLANQVWDVFAQTRDFDSMSTSGNGGPNFETPHGEVHVLVGGDGHMTQVAWSGFEPTFWLHHANVDRQVAMWQAIYPDAWLTNVRSPSGTWTILPNSIVGQSTPLTPFTMGDGITPYTSITARYTKNFGYSYPDVKDWLFSDPASLKANVTTQVNQLYNPTGSFGAFRSSTKRSTYLPSNTTTQSKETHAWSISVKVPNSAVDQAFSVKISMCDIYVGSLSILSVPGTVEREAGAYRVTHGQFNLGSALEGVDPDDVPAVIEHLKGKLRWEVVKIDGCVVDEVEGLELEVADRVVEVAEDISKFPTYGERTVHADVMA